jgi:predicted short-subunit dehydrogenase-like oxidoreductase (DUF2520 family)
MKIVIIGSGNVATVLGRKLQEAGHSILQVYGRDKSRAAILANELKCGYVSAWEAIDKDADINLIAISDDGLTGLEHRINFGNKLVVHTAGSVSKEVLKKLSRNYGVIYPLQSLRKEIKTIPEIPLLVDGNTEDSLTLIYDFASTISANVSTADDHTRLKLHVAAVLASNFTNHLYALAADYCNKEQIDFRLLLPLVQETADRLAYFPAGEMQTGPAIRHDKITIERHLKLLDNHPLISEVYRLLTENIQQFHCGSSGE